MAKRGIFKYSGPENSNFPTSARNLDIAITQCCAHVKHYCAECRNLYNNRKSVGGHMAGHRLDPIDRKILAELQADGRMTNVELAKRVGISAPPCLRRVRTLEEQGFIGGYHADVNARALGFWRCRCLPWWVLAVRQKQICPRSRIAVARGHLCVSVTCSTERWISC